MTLEQYQARFLHDGTNGLGDPSFHEAAHSRVSRAAVAFGLGLIAEVLQVGLRSVAAAINNGSRTVAAAISGQPLPATDNAAKLEAARKRIEAEAAAEAAAKVAAKMAAEEERLQQGDPS